MTFRDKNINTGDILQVSVWRYSEDIKNGALVISCGKDYLLSSDTVRKDSLGWDNIVLHYIIPPNHNDFMIYLWNGGDKPVWFDDLKVIKYKK